MRTAGGCSSIHQALTPEAATIVKQAINLARRRGHAQVTPIHVATVMLASPAGLLRSACLKSNSYPYQCKALELCFNVALNRLPATSSSPLLGPTHHCHYPALANALMAAFKRAQAHQRRGSIEAQQQPILALKIETEQLVVSILDDPSVSRVMREAGFSSTLIKSNVEQSLSEVSSQTNTTAATNISNVIASNLNPNPILLPTFNPFELGFSKPFSQARSEDVWSVIDSWLRRKEKSSVVLVGECLGSCEGMVRAVKERVERGDVPMELRYVQFLNCPLLAMRSLSREEIDMKLGEIRCLLKGCAGRGVVLYLGDLKWVAEYWAYYNSNGEQQKRQYYHYCPVEHLVMGLRRLVFGNVDNGRIWLMGVSTFNSFIKCKAGNPSLETLLDLHALTIPSATLDLSLNLDCNKSSGASGGDGVISWPLLTNKSGIPRNESTTTTSSNTKSSLPSWLLKCKEESTELSIHDQEESVQMKELCKKWDLICSSKSQKTSNMHEKTINFASCSPTSSPSISSCDNYCKPITAWPNIFESKWAAKEHEFLTPSNQTYLFKHTPKPEIISNPNSMPNSASSSETTEPLVAPDRFKHNTPENLEALCFALETKVPWQKHIIPEISTTVLRCRSGECKVTGSRVKQETWMSFLGADDDGKHKVARELAKLVFGTQTSSFKSIGLSIFSSTTRADSTEDCGTKNNKRTRDESSHGWLERLADAVRENPHRVFYVEDVEQLDLRSQKGIMRAMETGKLGLSNGDTVPLEDAIVIFSSDSFSSGSRACSPSTKQKLLEDNHHQDDVDEASSSSPFDLNIAVDDGDDGEQSVGEIRILEAVDKQVFFRIQLL